MNNWENIKFKEIVGRCRELAKLLKKTGICQIVAVTRGGLVPAAILAQFLGVRKISCIALASYDEQNQPGRLQCMSEPNLPIDEHTLFVDDLYDSGNTYSYLKERYPSAKVAVLYSKNPQAELDFPAEPKPADAWLIFPWEFEQL